MHCGYFETCKSMHVYLDGVGVTCRIWVALLESYPTQTEICKHVCITQVDDE